MYNAWDGKVYTLRNHKSTAKMDFSGVYKHDSKVSDESPDITAAPVVPSSTETWVCLACGKENTTKYCQECGAEKPYWVCSCGRVNSSNKFCGECGNSCAELITSFNNAISLMGEKEFVKAVEILESLGQFNCGSFDTDEGNHIEARNYIGKAYYDLAIYLQSTNGSHEAIVDAFEKAGNYADAQEQIAGENARYYKSFYDAGIEKQKAGEYDEAMHYIYIIYISYIDGGCRESSNLGHATVAFTLDVYGHVDEQMQKDSANRMQAFLETLCSGN